ncbi:hypothetical protein [Aquimarina algiphila]|uniref:Uncharacterized protein n=1 Tax=Aquimarina algiphila TaxID=2047982 RepID=A0A554VC89_9FLAO|nr:hypothetical protein [Aquimarina algiphila]TSE04317.1 hypothetical protein FOF46_26650 [Aquimarina algiphila]
MKNFYFIIKSMGVGLLVYSIAGLILACVLVNVFSSDHPHSMEHLLYLFIPGIGSIVGLSLGLILSILNLKTYTITRVLKQLIISVPIGVIVFFIVVEFFLS